jgi:PAS domain S-box-containing protein
MKADAMKRSDTSSLSGETSSRSREMVTVFTPGAAENIIEAGLQILHLESRPAEAEKVRAQLTDSGVPVKITHVDSLAAFSAAYERDVYDVLLLADRAPGHAGMKALSHLRDTRDDTPVIVLGDGVNGEAKSPLLNGDQTEYLPPMRHAQLSSVVRNVVTRRSGLLEAATLRRLLESARARSRELEAMINRSQLVILTLRPGDTWNVEFVSGAITELGYEPEEVVSGRLQFQEILHPADTDRVRSEVNEAIELGHDEVVTVFRVLTKAGSVRWLELHAGIRRFLNGSVTLEAVATDISDRRAAQEALVLSQSRMESLFRLATMEVHNERELISLALEEAVRLTGSLQGYMYCPGAESGAHTLFVWSEGISRELDMLRADGTNLAEIGVWKECIAAQRALICNDVHEQTVVEKYIEGHPDIRRHISVPIVENGRVTLVASVANKPAPYDDTDELQLRLTMVEVSKLLRRARLELQKDALLRAVEQSPASILITDIDGTITYVNPKVEEITGYLAEELLGNNPAVLKSGKHDDSMYRDLWTTIAAGDTWRGELVNRKRDGSYYWEQASISPVRDHTGRIRQYIAVKEDISARKAMEARLIAEKERAEESERVKDAFIANLSHEIRTPLNIILGYLGYLRRSLRDHIDEKEEGMFTTMTRAGEKLLNTVDQTLMVSRIHAGEYTMRRDPYHLQSRLPHLVDSFRELAQSKDLDLAVRFDTDDVYLLIDKDSFESALENILDNAIKYTDNGGVVVVVSWRDPHLVIEVIDSGVGMSEKYLARACEPFSQETMGYTRQYSGLGLGLTLAKACFEMNGARLELESRPTKGTTCRILLDGTWTDFNEPGR